MMDKSYARRELDRLIRTKGTSYAAMSRMLNRNAAYIQQYIRRGTPACLEERDRRILADFLGVDEAVLSDPSATKGQDTQDTIVAIPKLDVQASAGPGSILIDETHLGQYSFDRQWLREMGLGKPEDLSIIRVQGDSMAPTLIDGDDILVNDINGTDKLHDGIYVLQQDDVLLVKRLSINPMSGKLTITSDNATYPRWSDCLPDDVHVIGRAVWTCRKLI